METILEHLALIINGYNRPVIGLLQNGIDLSDNLRKNNLEYISNAALSTLYKWKNGTKILDGYSYNDMDFFPGYYFLSFEDSLKVIKTTNKNLGFLKPFIKNKKIWKPSFFPIFSNLDNGYLIVDLAKSDSPVYFFSEEILLKFSNLPLYYSNLASMFNTILKCYQDNAYSIMGSSVLISDIITETEITHLLNPNSMFNII